VRVERDRRGGLRVFQGSALQGGSSSPQISRPNLPQPDVEEYENQPIEPQSAAVAETAAESADGELETIGQMPIDTTAELLGRAKSRKPRARAPRPLAAAPKKAAAKKPAAKKPSRKKAAASDDDAGNR